MLGPGDVRRFPDEDDVAERKRQLKGQKTGSGKRSAEEMAAADECFLAECQANMKSVADLSALQPLTAEELVDFAADQAKLAASLVAKASGKLQSVKRRKSKNAVEDQSVSTFGCLIHTAKVFQRFYHELGASNPDVNELSNIYKGLLKESYSIKGVALFVIARARAIEDLKFGKHQAVAEGLCSGSEVGDLLLKLEEEGAGADASGKFGDLLLGQLIQRLLAAVPLGKLTSAMQSSQCKSLFSLLTAFAKVSDNSVLISSDVKCQISALRNVISQDSQVLAHEALDSLDVIEKSDSSAQTTQSALFGSFTTLKQGKQILSELRAFWTKRSKGQEGVKKIALAKKEITEFLERVQGDMSSEDVLSNTVACKDHHDALSSISKTDVGDANIKEQLKIVQRLWQDEAVAVLRCHATTELPAYLELISKDIMAKNELRQAPVWNATILRDGVYALEEGSAASKFGRHLFLTHDFIVTFVKEVNTWAQKPDLSGAAGAKKVELHQRWQELRGELLAWMENTDKLGAAVCQMSSFEAAMESLFTGSFAEEAKSLHKAISEQVQQMVEADAPDAALFDVGKCDQLLRVCHSMESQERGEAAEAVRMAAELTIFAEAAKHVLHFSFNALLYVQNQGKILCTNSKLDSATRDLMAAFKECRASVKNYFVGRDLEALGKLLLPDESQPQDKLTGVLTDMVVQVDKNFRDDLIDKMQQTLADAKRLVVGALEKVPAYNDADVQPLIQGIKTSSLGEHAGAAKKAAEAAAALLAASGLDEPAVVEAVSECQDLAVKGLSAVSAGSIALILRNKLWRDMTQQLAAKKDSKHATLLSHLKENKDFSEKNNLKLPCELHQKMISQLQKFGF
ncbi:unnamed protein product [Symbiodinium microadriaticum]|nr:unnamed protein product [Symbiodinium microadriaticum]CAE7262602.1 unnamed protein product [Symbiodinium sp. KB8]